MAFTTFNFNRAAAEADLEAKTKQMATEIEMSSITELNRRIGNIETTVHGFGIDSGDRMKVPGLIDRIQDINVKLDLLAAHLGVKFVKPEPAPPPKKFELREDT